MANCTKASVAAAVVLALFSAAAQAQLAARKEPLAVRVKIAMDRGVAYLKDKQRRDGGWEIDVPPALQFGGGNSVLAVLALLNCGLTPDEDKSVARGLDYLRDINSDFTYVKALQTMAYAEARRPEDLQRIQKNVQWLLDGRIFDGQGRLLGWGYGKGEAPRTGPDNSNSQYALLGLWAGKQAGIPIDEKVWQQIIDFYKRTQNANGSWSYVGQGKAKITMTTAGLCGLLIAGMEIGTGREQPLVDGVARNCGIYDENPEVARALNWLGSNLRYDFPEATFYNIYGIERAGRLSGQRFFGDHDWYREGCEFLVDLQDRQDGSWKRTISPLDRYPIISTSFALLFLSKGRTPILISKVVHSPFADMAAREADTDWNNDRNDLRHLTQFASKNLFHGKPLAWQSFDLLRAWSEVDRLKKQLDSERADVRDPDKKAGRVKMLEEKIEAAPLDIVSEMLQSPIMYINGHKSPFERFSDAECDLLRQYVDNGGFIFAEACCKKKEFDEGFKKLAHKLWPNAELKELGSGHPVWTSKFVVTPGDPYRLYGIEMGCKTVLIYSPEDMSCRFEANNLVEGDRAFKLGANIIAYATGLEPPQPRLTQTELAKGKDLSSIPRGFFKVGQLKYKGKWQPAPRAMHNLLDFLNKHNGLDVALKTDELIVDKDQRALIDYKFIYLQGRESFAYDPANLKHLRFNLENGGLLFADACCGKPAFDKAFRKFAAELFPDRPLVEVPLDDELFSKELNGVKLDANNIKCRIKGGEAAPMRKMAPMLEGIKVNNRWAVIYSKYDIGCALERHRSSDCLGYDTDSAFKIAGAAVLYLLKLP